MAQSGGGRCGEVGAPASMCGHRCINEATHAGPAW